MFQTNFTGKFTIYISPHKFSHSPLLHKISSSFIEKKIPTENICPPLHCHRCSQFVYAMACCR